jgi:NADPH:quinone reductase-like Zn-dependent oxidoreductase
MRSYHAESGGGPASLVVKEHPVRQPGPHEVLIRVRANSLNAREVSVLNGTYPRTGQVLTVAAAPRVGWP